ncbi:glycosyltransferase [Chroococcus sp. FPU101]|uniref:glycosyltransferase n=1 Tax=Chroococcus sp. FPU101 TaxID=1974212 RepID=UPI001AA854E6|nr:glycosyltransferase [Chroococcus sp. FPU101]GFE68190.1 hypothetical protein CFPU101_08000 [Chroococcus sp. FPU101]
MQVCDLIAHTSILPEPFGRVIVEAMLCGRPVIAAGEGGVRELIENEKTGWLFASGNAQQLAEKIIAIKDQSEPVQRIAKQAQFQASQRFDLKVINQQIEQELFQLLSN